jgi:uroporphyrin-3 C-methyltransferase
MTDPTADFRSPDDDADLRQRERLRGDARRVERALRHGAIALLVAIVALGVALFAGWRTLENGRAIEARPATAAPDRDRVDGGLTRRGDPAVAESLARLDPLVARVDQLDARLGRAEARLEAPERSVARVEAAHLVELGSRRLALDRDVAGAIVLFEAAEQRLAVRGDATALRIRAQLAHDLAALRAAALPDLHAIGGRLAGAESAVRDLPMLGAIRSQYVPSAASTAPEGGARRAWHQFTTSLQDLVSVRRVSDASVRLVSVEEIGVRRRHLQTLLLAARLAALRADQVEYTADLAEAGDWLARYFDSNDPRTRALAAELSALGASRVASDLPDVSGSLRALRASAP